LSLHVKYLYEKYLLTLIVKSIIKRAYTVERIKQLFDYAFD